MPAWLESEQQQAETPSAPLWTPYSGPQTSAYTSTADVIGYGGAAGGGKSDLMLGYAFTKHRRSLIFRREKSQLRKLWERALEIAGIEGESNATLHLIRNLPGRRSIELGGVKDEGDWKSYQGQDYDLHGFDELTEFTEAQFRTLIGWNRTVIPGQKCRVVAAFNPPTTVEGEWVIQYFGPWLDQRNPHPAEPGEVRWFVQLPGAEKEQEWANGNPFTYWNELRKANEVITPKSRTFFPARVADNPALVAQGYVATLQNMPEPMRSRFLYGDFTIGRDDPANQVIPTEWVRAAMDRWEPPKPDQPITAIGVDVSRGGSDKAVIAPRSGYHYHELVKIPGAETAEARRITQVVLALASGQEWVPRINVDADGNGAGVVENLRDRNVPHYGVRAGAAARVSGQPFTDRSGLLTFRDWRSWMWWRLRELLDPASGVNVMLPPDAELRAELCAPHWETQLGGIKVEQKADIKKRLGRSTDSADAVIHAAIEVADLGPDHLTVTTTTGSGETPLGIDGRPLGGASVSTAKGAAAEWPREARR